MARTRRSLAMAPDGNTPPTAIRPSAPPKSGLSTQRPQGRLPETIPDTPMSDFSAPTPTAYGSGSENTTPPTSNGTTPAPSVLPTAGPSTKKKQRLASIKVHRPVAKDAGSALKVPGEAGETVDASQVGKRKRPIRPNSDLDDDSDETPDAKIARRLQEEEYAQVDNLTYKGKGKGVLGASLPDPGPRRSLRNTPGLSGRHRSMASSRNGGMGSENGEDNDDDDDDDDEVPLRLLSKAKPPPRRLSSKQQDELSEEDDLSEPSLADPSEPSEGDDDEDGDGDGDGDGDHDDDNGGDANDANQPSAGPVPNINRLVRRGRGNYSNRKRMETDRAALEKMHPEITTMWADLEKMPVLKAGRAAQPPSISRQLKPFQLEGLAWMQAMEKTEWRGGLLGDDMGLGKTIQAVSLVMSDFPAKKPSLVLVPPVAMMQWQAEIESYTDGTLKTLVMHGTNPKAKKLTLKELKKYHVIIMSYNSLESMYRKQVKGFKRKHGMFTEASVMHQAQFHRIILDEAHSIKTRSTMTAKACFALKTTFRWCLSGTPLQNRIGEFFSLVRFLNIQPFSSYLCKDCKCTSVEWSVVDGMCLQCEHSGMRHVSVFNQELLNPIQRFGNQGEGKEAFQKLRTLTDRMMLRRLKKDHTDAMELPVKEVNVERQFFGEEENDFAASITSSGQRKFDTYVAAGVLLNNYANIFGLIMQMRQVADHPDLILRKNSEGGQNVLVCCICDEPAEEPIRSSLCKHTFCRTCACNFVNGAGTEGADCPQCHVPLSIDLEQPALEQDQLLVKKSSIINRIKMENWTSSSKIELLVHELHRMRCENASHKSIIFSQFTSMLQLVEWRLRRAGITTVMLDGTMTPAQRQASITHFMGNTEVECFLVSLKAGGVALNLTEASRVFIVDPWWNPAAEWQSADRCHRIGQSRPCTITRLCIEDSVESRMVLLQEKKTSMINTTINMDDAAMDSLTPEDMQFLFRGT